MDRRTRRLLEAQEPEVLLALIESMEEKIESLSQRVEKAEAEKLEKAQQAMNIEEQVKLLRTKLFGRSKEDRAEATDRPRDKSQQEAMLFSQAAFPSPEERAKAPLKSLVPEQAIYHELTAEELKNESKDRGVETPAASQWQKLEGVYDKLTQIQIIERKYIKQIHHKAKYKLKDEFNTSDKDVIVTASGPDQLLPGMTYTPEVVASVVTDKYVCHMPLERQTRKMESLGLKGMRTSTLSRFCALAAASLEPLQEEILGELKTSDLALHLDETPWKIQNKEQKDGYMWIISNRYGSYYFYKPTRSGEVIREKLAGYSGSVMSDGYAGYNQLDDEKQIKQGYCWAHARRSFLVLEGHDPSVKPILDKIDDLFKLERQAKNFEELYEIRESRSGPVVKELKLLLEQEYPASRIESQKRKAIEYLLKRWPGFTRFLTDLKLPLSNNEAERTIRHAVVGRKNFYGAATHAGADTAATIYTVVESCKKNDLDPTSFLLMALKMVARGDVPPTPLAYARQTRQ